MPSFAPYIQRAGEQTTTIVAPPHSAGDLNQRLNQGRLVVNKDVKLRRYQRWFFYGLFVVLFLAALGFLLKVYSDNTKLVANLENVNTQLKQKDKDLDQLRNDLTARAAALEASGASLEEVRQQLAKSVSDMNEAAVKNKQLEDSLTGKDEETAQNKLTLEKAKANTLNLLLDLGIVVSDAEIAKVAVANVSVAGMDTDKDGLSDDWELALGTDPLKTDTDSDNYSDQEEVFGGFNPLGKGLLPLDKKTGDKYRGKILLNQKKDIIYAWYVAQNGQRYYLGNSVDKFEALRQSDYWTRERQ